tara:strand:+ start:315 stop:734 length:420 start_codon:yes stop_codon:yes gene_type:complete
MSMKDIYEDSIFEFIRHGEYDPSDHALSLVWKSLCDKLGAVEVLNEAINGDESLSDDIINWVKFKDSGDQGRLRVNEALCRYAFYHTGLDEDLIWQIYENSIDTCPDPMTLAKESSTYMDEIAGSLKDVYGSGEKNIKI